MKRTLWILAMMLVSITALAYEKTFGVGNFEGIECEGAAAIKFTTGTSEEVRAEGKSEEVEKYEVYVKSQTLYIRVKREAHGKNGARKTVTFYVSAPKLNHIYLSGASSFTANQLVMSGTRISISGASSFKTTQITAKNQNIEASGASNFIVKSLVANNVRASFHGSSDFEIEKSNVANLNMEQTGAGSAKLTATATGDAGFSFSGCCSFNLSVSTPGTVQLGCSGSSDGKINARCERLKISTTGVSGVTATTTASRKEVQSTGLSKVTFNSK
jgi:hypothetical protein